MKYLLVSDTHANREALEAVLAQADFDRLLFLGDAVDYGPDPEAVVDLLRAAAREHATLVRGNHDEAVARPQEELDTGWWSALAHATMQFTRRVLSADQRAFLGGLPATATVDLGAGGRALLCHGVPSSNREYLWPDLPEARARALVESGAGEASYLFVGHTHLQFERRLGPLRVVNPGSVGQPRDGDPRAAFALFDTAEGRLSFHRVPYPVEATAARIRERALPHADRLVEILRRGGG